jgi:hypothetical protein
MPRLAKLLQKYQTIHQLGSQVEFCVGMESQEEREIVELVENRNPYF